MKQKLSEQTALFTGIASIMLAAWSAGMARHYSLSSFTSLIPLIFMATATSLVVYFRLRLSRISEEEHRDQSYLRQEQGNSNLFQTKDEAAPFSAAHTLRQIERHLIPWFAPLLGSILMAWTWRIYQRTPWDMQEPTGLNVSAALFGVFAFASFLTSRFLLGMSRHGEARLLRGPGIALGLVCWGAVAGLAGVMASQFGWNRGIILSAWAVLAVTGVVGVELVLNSLLSLYLHKREKVHVTYESRLGALLVDPGILGKSFTEAIDYQFGFSFSHTWFFRILQKAIIPLVTAQLLLLYTMSSVVFLDVHESGILERFGKPVADEPVLSAGFHLKKPWPIETVRRVPTGRIQKIEVGFTPHDDGNPSQVIIWTIPHYAQEDTFLVASRGTTAPRGETTGAAGVAVSMVSINLAVEYRITNAFAYTYRFAHPDELLRQLGYQAATRQLARHDLKELLSENRSEVSRQIQHDLQMAADSLQLGVHLEYASLQSVHPPVQVADAFQSVVGALEEKEASILEARAYTNQVIPLAHAYAESSRREAEVYRHRRVEIAAADAAWFDVRHTVHEVSPRAFRAYQYLDMLQRAVSPSRLYVVDLPDQGAQTLWLNLEEKQFSGVLDMAPLMLEGGHE